MKNMEKTLEKDVVFQGRIITVRKDRVLLPNKRETTREVVEHLGGGGIVPLDGEKNVYMVRQYRYPFEKELLEIPAGKLEVGEEPLACAIRELSEETGFTAENYEYLGMTYPSPGYCKEILHIYMATGLTVGTMHLDENEFLCVEKFSLDTLVQMIRQNQIADAKTVIGILKTKLYLE